jgi:hypothetical protein
MRVREKSLATYPIVECPRVGSTDVDVSCRKMIDGPPESADHLGRLEEEGWGDGEAQRRGGLEVDD